MFRNHAKYSDPPNILYPCFRWYPTRLNVWKEGRDLSNEGNYGVKVRATIVLHFILEILGDCSIEKRTFLKVSRENIYHCDCEFRPTCNLGRFKFYQMLLDFLLFSLTLPHTIGTDAVYTFLQPLETDILGQDRWRMVKILGKTTPKSSLLFSGTLIGLLTIILRHVQWIIFIISLGLCEKYYRVKTQDRCRLVLVHKTLWIGLKAYISRKTMIAVLMQFEFYFSSVVCISDTDFLGFHETLSEEIWSRACRAQFLMCRAYDTTCVVNSESACNGALFWLRAYNAFMSIVMHMILVACLGLYRTYNAIIVWIIHIGLGLLMKV